MEIYEKEKGMEGGGKERERDGEGLEKEKRKGMEER